MAEYFSKVIEIRAYLNEIEPYLNEIEQELVEFSEKDGYFDWM